MNTFQTRRRLLQSTLALSAGATGPGARLVTVRAGEVSKPSVWSSSFRGVPVAVRISWRVRSERCSKAT